MKKMEMKLKRKQNEADVAVTASPFAVLATLLLNTAPGYNIESQSNEGQLLSKRNLHWQ